MTHARFSIRICAPRRLLSAAGFVFAALAAPAPGDTWTVSNLNNTGAGSLRWAIEDANASSGPDVVVIDGNLTGTITLTTGQIDVFGTITIHGPGAGRLAISGNDLGRIFSLASGAALTLNDLTLQNGRGPGGTLSFGGAIYAAHATLRMHRCVVRDCQSVAITSAWGGAIYAQSCTLSFEDCTFTNNTAAANTYAEGGWMSALDSTLTLRRCTLAANRSDAGTLARGGGIYMSNATAEFEHCTIAFNELSAVFPEGGGLHLEGTAPVSLAHTLLAANQAGNASGNVAALASAGFNLDSDGTTGFIQNANGDVVGTPGAPLDARLFPVADNGGPTPTVRLLRGSPAIDAAIATRHALDQRGYPRVADGDCDGIARADIGAYEYNAGRGLNFDGVDDHVDLGFGPEFNFTNNFTLEAWVRADSVNSGGPARILGDRSFGNAGYGFGQTQGGKLNFTTFSREDFVTSQVYVVPNVWVHVAVVFDTANDATFYVNGQAVETMPGSFPAYTNSAPLYIGRNFNPDAQRWDGAIADVRIWNVARTAGDIAATYASELTGNEPGLVGWYRLDEGNGATALDAVSGQAAAIHGGPAWIAAAPCPPCIRGDANCDGLVNFFDVDPFVLALFNLSHYEADFCGGDVCTADTDCSGAVNFLDIDTFVECLFGNSAGCP